MSTSMLHSSLFLDESAICVPEEDDPLFTGEEALHSPEVICLGKETDIYERVYFPSFKKEFKYQVCEPEVSTSVPFENDIFHGFPEFDFANEDVGLQEVSFSPPTVSFPQDSTDIVLSPRKRGRPKGSFKKKLASNTASVSPRKRGRPKGSFKKKHRSPLRTNKEEFDTSQIKIEKITSLQKRKQNIPLSLSIDEREHMNLESRKRLRDRTDLTIFAKNGSVIKNENLSSSATTDTLSLSDGIKVERNNSSLLSDVESKKTKSHLKVTSNTEKYKTSVIGSDFNVGRCMSPPLTAGGTPSQVRGKGRSGLIIMKRHRHLQRSLEKQIKTGWRKRNLNKLTNNASLSLVVDKEETMRTVSIKIKDRVVELKKSSETIVEDNNTLPLPSGSEKKLELKVNKREPKLNSTLYSTLHDHKSSSQESTLDGLQTKDEAFSTSATPKNVVLPLSKKKKLKPEGGTNKRFRKHRKKIQQNTKQHECDVCGNKYVYIRGLRQHEKYECNKEPQFPCPYCPNRFRYPQNIRDHVSKMHPQAFPKWYSTHYPAMVSYNSSIHRKSFAQVVKRKHQENTKRIDNQKTQCETSTINNS